MPPRVGSPLCKRAATACSRPALKEWEIAFPVGECGALGERAARLQLFTYEPRHDDEAEDDQHRVEAVEPGLEGVDVLAQLHADPRQAEAPGQRSGEGVDDELSHRHPRYARWESDERPHHRQEPRDED